MNATPQHGYSIERANDGVMTRTMKGTINFWNHGAERLYGWRKEEAIGRVSHDLLQTQFPQPLGEIESELARNGRWEGKLVHSTRDGGRVTVHSRWILDRTMQPGTVVEINAHSAGEEKNSQPPSKAVLFANAILCAGICICLAAYFYSAYFYDVAGTRSYTAFGGVLVYQILPGITALLLAAALLLPSSYRINLALVVCSIGFSLYGAEVLLGLSASMSSSSETLWGDGRFRRTEKKEVVALAKRFGADFDTRTRLEVIRDLGKQDIKAVPTIVPLGLLKEQPDGTVKSAINIGGAEVLPLGGISNRTTVLCNETGKYAIYDSDERGFHNPQGIWRSKRMAIVGVGDSFTQGNCVSSDQNFMALIRNQYPGALNLGMSGEGPLTMLAALTEYLPAVKPKVALWFFYEGNDFDDFLKESKTPLLRKYLEGNFNQGLVNRQADIDEALIHYVERHMNAELAKKDAEARKVKEDENTWLSPGAVIDSFQLSLVRQKLGLVYGQAVQKPEDPYTQAQLDLFHSVLLRAKSSVEGSRGTLYFVYLPARDRYAKGQDYHRQWILDTVREIGIPVIDVHARFQRESDPLRLFPFGRFGHYNEEGNRLVAEEVLHSISPAIS